MQDSVKKKKRKHKLWVQITIPLVFIEVFFIVITSVAFFLYNVDHYVEERFKSTQNLGMNLASEMKNYKSIDFLSEYWQEHYDEMDFFYGNQKKLLEKMNRLKLLRPSLTDVTLYTTEEVKTRLDEEGQKLFAEICYYQLAEKFDTAKRAFSTKFLYSFVVRDGKEGIFLITGALSNEKRISQGGELFELGYKVPYEKGVYPILDEVLKTESSPTRMELSNKEGAIQDVVHVFEPVVSNGKMLMVIGVGMEWKDIVDSVLAFSLRIAAGLAIMFVLLGLLIMRRVKKVAMDPIKEEQRIIKSYELNKDIEETLDNLSKISTRNEIQSLAEEFSNMLLELEKYNEDIIKATAEKERISAELDLARVIQENQLPSKFPAFPGRMDFDIYASMTPAKEVGGDFYDFYLLDDDHLALVIADVSGKGIPASLFMMMSKILINNYSAMGLSPKEVLEKANDTIFKYNKQRMFVTVWFGVLEISTGKVCASNAGHEYPIIKQPDGKFELYKDKHGFVAGAVNKMKYTEYEFELEKGGILFLYTDGVPEATNAQEEMYGTQRLVDQLNKMKGASPKELLEGVHKSVDEFVGDAPQFDDLTMLCIRRN
ncbi:MAG: PP2C family protein-serine/threonine phosphatase [Ruminococcus sp.]|nr:PP2C family protein-serine/threonine phosphatase [Ruminococcus sp.]